MSTYCLDSNVIIDVLTADGTGKRDVGQIVLCNTQNTNRV